jgi:pimeloyl-ACP methyl ester carboxylesterase
MLKFIEQPFMPRPIQNAFNRRPPGSPPPETIDPIWLLKALAAVIVLAFICGYLALCLLFYQGQWQLVLHPVRTATAPQSIDGTSFQIVHFAPDDSAIPQLTGWWIPSDPGGHYHNTTVLFLPAGDGSLADSIPTLAVLHTLGINVFAFDYRGYGQSANVRPNQRKMTEDAASAWQYLTQSRAVPARQIVPYGTGTGTSLAAQLAIDHPEIPALILDSPRADLLASVRRDSRSRFVPVKLLFHEDFPLAKTLEALRTPKLLLSESTTSDQPPAAFRTASDPKITVEFKAATKALEGQTFTRFLDQYLPQSVPSPAPAR